MKPGCFFPCPSNVVTALANGAVQAGSLSVFSLAHLTLSLPWLMELCKGCIRPDSSFQGSPTEARPTCHRWLLAGRPGSRLGCCGSFRGQAYLPGATTRWFLAGRPGSRLGECKSIHQEYFLANVKLRVKTSNVDLSAPRHSRAIMTAYLDT